MVWILLLLRRYGPNRPDGSSPYDPTVPLPLVLLIVGALIAAGVYAAVTLTGRNVAPPRPVDSTPHRSPPRSMSPEPAPRGTDLAGRFQDDGTMSQSFQPARWNNRGPTVLMAPSSDNGTATALMAPEPVSPSPTPAETVAAPSIVPVAAPAATLAISPVPANPTPDSIADAVTRLKHPDWNTRYQSVVWLSTQKPGAEDRSDVTGTLADLLADPDGAIHTATLTAIRHWADASTDKVLADKIASAKGDALHDLLNLAAAIKTDTLAEAVAPLLADANERIWARRCLLAMGPVAEHAVAGQLESQDAGVRVEACRLLEILGTRASIPALKTHLRVTEKDDSVQSAATLAISVIESRGK